MKVTSIRLTLTPDKNHLATVSLTIDNAVSVCGIILGTRKDGSYYIRMPALGRDKNGKPREPFFPVSQEARSELMDAILARYEKCAKDTSLSGAVEDFDVESSMTITEVRVNLLTRDNDFVKAFAHLTIDNAVAIHGMRFAKRADGSTTILMPAFRHEPKEGEEKPTYINVCHPISSEAREAILKAVSAKYDEAVAAAGGDEPA